jgi:hypothetical protein
MESWVGTRLREIARTGGHGWDPDTICRFVLSLLPPRGLVSASPPPPAGLLHGAPCAQPRVLPRAQMPTETELVSELQDMLGQEQAPSFAHDLLLMAKVAAGSDSGSDPTIAASPRMCPLSFTHALTRRVQVTARLSASGGSSSSASAALVSPDTGYSPTSPAYNGRRSASAFDAPTAVGDAEGGGGGAASGGASATASPAYSPTSPAFGHSSAVTDSDTNHEGSECSALAAAPVVPTEHPTHRRHPGSRRLFRPTHGYPRRLMRWVVQAAAAAGRAAAAAPRARGRWR